MIPPINASPPTTPHSKPLRQRVGDVANTALNAYSVVAGTAFGTLIVYCLAKDAKMARGKRWWA